MMYVAESSTELIPDGAITASMSSLLIGMASHADNAIAMMTICIRSRN